MQIFNSHFVQQVWAKRRAAVAAKKPTLGEIVVDFQHRKREADRARKAAKRAEEYRKAAAKRLEPLGDERVAGIIRDVARKRGVPVALILTSKYRHGAISDARHEAIVEACLRRPDLSLVQIGRAFRMHHTSVIHALRKAGIESRPRSAA